MKTSLLVIDMQKGFEEEAYWGGNRNSPELEQNIESLITTARSLQFPIFYIKHCSTEMNSPLVPERSGNQFMDWIEPRSDEAIIHKEVNSAFINTTLDEDLRKENVNCLIMVGLTSNHCVSTTARMAGNMGYKVFVPSDATATFDRLGIDGVKYSSELVHIMALSSIHREFCEVLKTKDLVRLLEVT